MSSRGMGSLPMFEVLLDFDRYPDRVKQERGDLSSLNRSAAIVGRIKRMPKHPFQVWAVVAMLLVGLASFAGCRGSHNSAAVRSPERGEGESNSVAATTFFGITGTGNRVVFVCELLSLTDDEFCLLRAALRKAIEPLKPSQSFGLIFYYSDIPIASSGMVASTAENKQKVFEWMSQLRERRGGGPDPQPAIEAALKMHPQLFYFFCDPACFPDREAIHGLIRAHTQKEPIRINMIALGHDPENEKWLKEIAAENGGTYRYIPDLGALNLDRKTAR